MFGVRPGGSGSRITEIASRRLLYRPRHGSVRTVRLHVGSLDHDIVERTRMQLHLIVCESCTNFNAQMALLRRAVRKAGAGSLEDPSP